MRRQIKTIGASERLLRDRRHNEITPDLSNQKSSQKPGKDVIMLSKHQYAKHKRARNQLLSDIGRGSELYHTKKINEERLLSMAVESAKKSVRTVGLGSALRAWIDVFHRMDVPERRVVNNIPISLWAWESAWSTQFGWENERSAQDIPAPIGPLPKPKEVNSVEDEKNETEVSSKA